MQYTVEVKKRGETLFFLNTTTVFLPRTGEGITYRNTRYWVNRIDHHVDEFGNCHSAINVLLPI